MKLSIKLMLLAVLLIAGATSQLYHCNVQNCAACSSQGFCGLCKNNYQILMNSTTGMPYCSPLECPQNCLTCFQDNICEVCQDDYLLQVDGGCSMGDDLDTNQSAGNTTSPLPSNCLIFEDGQCLLCAAGYNSQEGVCHSDVPLPYGCQIAFNPQMCQLCLPGNYLMFGFQCTENNGLECNIPGCSSCSEANVCNACIYPLTNKYGVCVENLCPENCLSCQNDTCIQCQTGYAMFDGNCSVVSYACPDRLCESCLNGPGICVNCLPGFYLRFLYDGETSKVVASICMQITLPMLFDAQAAQNCQTFGSFDPLQPADLYGCIECAPGFMNIAGYCVANLQNNVACGLEFCLSCSMPNFCNTCQAGYYVREGTGGFCQPKTSLQPNCAWSVYAGQCIECNAGFQVYMGACYPISEVSCTMTGCQYCLEEEECEVCLPGFSVTSNGGCSARNPVANCWFYTENDSCDFCKVGYHLSGTSCVQGIQINYDCSDTPFAEGCASCSEFNCFSCLEGFSLNIETLRCCQNTPNNNAGCISYNGPCNAYCQQCAKGYLLVDGECYALPCSIENCAYCFRSESCIVCDEGYTLNNSTGTCEAYTSDCSSNCVACQNGACTECVNGYQLYEGVCVCGFQNCLECVSDYFCTKCAGPSVPAFLEGGGCIPAPVSGTLCQVEFCSSCFAINMCSKCAQGYSLTVNGTCQINDCSDANCELCSSDQNFCYACSPGYMPDAFMGKNCVDIPYGYSCVVDGCAVCMAYNQTACQTCNQMYQSNGAGGCVKISCLDNCLYCIQNSTCTVCSFGYYLNTNNVCEQSVQPNGVPCVGIDNCLMCRVYEQNQMCTFCAAGFQVSQDGQSCVPQSCNLQNCQICLPDSQANPEVCMICQQGYFLNSYLQCVGYSPEPVTATCDIYNCIYCADDYWACTLCVEGWSPAPSGQCVTTLYCSVENCLTCTSPSICLSCQPNYTMYQGLCYLTVPCDVTNCLFCESANTCLQCAGMLVPSSNGGLCQCPSETTYYQGFCYMCDIEFCSVCMEDGVCSTCEGELSVMEGGASCNCTEGFEQEDDECACPAGTTESNGVCISCDIEYCAVCSQGSVFCSQCEQNFILLQGSCFCPGSLYQGQCYSCNIRGCNFCSANNVCASCYSTFVLASTGLCQCPAGTYNNNNTCTECLIKYCSQCGSKNSCTTCIEPFVNVNGSCVCPSSYTQRGLSCVCANNDLNQNISMMWQVNYTCYECEVENCLTCTSYSLTCLDCEPDYELYQGQCYPNCGIANCQVCESLAQCQVCTAPLVLNEEMTECICSEGLQVSSSGATCVVCSGIPGCATCSQNNVCSSCETGFSLNTQNNTCDICPFPCSVCIPGSTTCANCTAPYSALPNPLTGKCFTCSVAHCASCQYSSPSVCLSCNSGYTNVNGLCQNMCGSNLCTACENGTSCTKCVIGYAPSGNTCVQCADAPQCIRCSANDVEACTRCNLGYYLSNSTCLSCPSNCQICNSTNCLLFKASTQQLAIRIGNLTLPALCDFGCKKCSSSSVSQCLTCLPGFFLQTDNTCEPCAFPCKTCTSNTNTSCLSCYSNAYLVSGSCQTCTSTSNCLTCQPTNLTACTSCPYGYSLSSGNVCVKGCPSNCLACSNSSICTLCMNGYSPNANGACMPCLSTCRECSSTANGVCLSCGTGFYLNASSVCTACSAPYCSTCSSIGCSQCLPGYTLTSAFTCAKNCKVPCSTCSETNPSICTSCLAGYTFDTTTNQCVAVTSCPGGCHVCPLGYVLYNQQCLSCTNSACARCSSYSLSVCTTCYQGMYLFSGMCFACPTGCESCSNPLNCLSCSSGYTAQVQSVQTNSVCVACESPCAQCIGNPQTCSSCMLGYTMVGWKCVSLFNFELSVTFLSDPDVFYTKYETFITRIASIVGNSDANQITVNKIKKGSTEVALQVSTKVSSTTKQASAQLKKLKDTFKTNSEFEGMKIISSNVNSIGGEVTPIKTVDLGLILGITIPIAVIVIAVIGFLIKRSFSKSAPPPYNDRGIREEFEMTPHI